MTTEERLKNYAESYPEIHLLSKDKLETVAYLLQQNWLEPDQSIQKLEKPGDGNMNLVLRVVLDGGSSFIIKQARPWVEKFPQLEAPVERILVEQKYFETVRTNEYLKDHSPEVLGFDGESFIMKVEDLGESSDFTNVYQSGQYFTKEEIRACINYLNELSGMDQVSGFPENLKLRKLNHQHIFYLPFIHENDFDLDSIQSGLQGVSQFIKNDEVLKKIVTQLGEVYLSTGKQLLHGDFYPGSILNTSRGVKVIDPEFGFTGPVEWDIAIYIAHLYMAETSAEDIREAYHYYQKPEGFDDQRFAGFVGTEVIRRIIGLAQLPLSLTLSQKKELLEKAVQWIKHGYAD